MTLRSLGYLPSECCVQPPLASVLYSGSHLSQYLRHPEHNNETIFRLGETGRMQFAMRLSSTASAKTAWHGKHSSCISP